jgi:hypothetical protein
MRNTVTPVLAAVLAALVLAPAAQAQNPGENDPDAGSPTGRVYEIPLESARDDAAPQPSEDEGDSSIRSENGFGSSSEVPAATPEPTPEPTPVPPVTAPAVAEEEPKSRARRQRKNRRERSSARRERLRAERERRRPERERADDGNVIARLNLYEKSAAPTADEPSRAGTFLLLALGVVAAGGLGAAARRGTR